MIQARSGETSVSPDLCFARQPCPVDLDLNDTARCYSAIVFEDEDLNFKAALIRAGAHWGQPRAWIWV